MWDAASTTGLTAPLAAGACANREQAQLHWLTSWRACMRVRAGLDAWQLAAVDQLVTSSKSLVVAAALAAGRLGVAGAVSAARLEEDFQLEDWGMVEAGHDLDITDTNTRIGGPAVFLKLLKC